MGCQDKITGRGLIRVINNSKTGRHTPKVRIPLRTCQNGRPPVGHRGTQAADVRADRHPQPAQATFLTAAEERRRVPANGSSYVIFQPDRSPF